MKELLATVKQNIEIAKGIWAITLTLPESVGKIRGGQFANLSVGDSSFPLKRPLGICGVNGDDIMLCYQLKGDGTHRIAEKKVGDKLSVLLPLGNGFDLGSAENIAVIGGGVGIFPLAAVIQEHSAGRNFYSYIGFRGKEYACLTEEFMRAFAVNSGLTLHMKCHYGKNAHHITEALFKSLGVAVKEAVQITGTGVTSTKGVL